MRKFFSLITALVLCTAMWGAATYKTFYKVQGALYQGINVDFTTNKNMFVPNGASVTYTTFDGKAADWYNNGSLKKSGQSSYKVSNLADASYYKYQIKNYTGYDAQDPKIDYMYGTVDNKNYFLRAGSGTMYMMSMANAYCVCTESSTASNVGKYYVDNKSMLTLTSTDAATYETSMKYGTNFSYAKNGGLIFAYEMLVDNPGEMYIDYIVLPIFGYPKTDETTIAKMIPEGKKLTLTLYPIDLTLATDGKYSYTRKTPAITTVTATKENFNQGDKVYNGTVKFDLSNNPLLISGDFVARLTWDDGCEFGLITDDNNLQNFTTFYLWKKADGTITKSYMWTSSSANASISYHAMFPVLEKKDTKTALEFTHEGGGDEVAIKSNIDPSSKDFSIDFGGADWISLDSLRYTTEGKYVAKETVYVVFKAEANTGEAREATITLKHHGKELTYTVSQEAAPAPRILYLNTGGSNLWNQSSAKFSAYYWAEGVEGKFTGFLTAIEGNADIFVATIPADIKKVIFVRHANDATKAEWDDNKVWNQTTDLDISDDKDMYTITAWGEGTKVCSGVWSKYTKPAVITYKDSVYYVAGNFTKWAAEMKKLPAEVELPADSALEFKEVLTRTVLADGDSVRQDTIWYGQPNKGNFMTRDNSTWKLDGAENVLATTDIAGKYTFSINEKGEFVLGWPKEPVITYKDSVYYVAGNFTKWAAEMKKLPAEVELPADSALEFKQVLTRTVLADGDSVRQDTIWYGQPNKGNFMTRDNSTWKLDGAENVLAKTDIAGIYTFDLNEKGEFVLGWPEIPAEVLPMITEAPKSWAGEYVITAMKDENTALVWTGIDAGQCRVEAPVVDNKLANKDFVKVVVEALAEGGYSIKVKGGTNDGKYMTQKATPAYGNALSFVDSPVRVDIEMNEGGLVDIYQTISATQKVYLLYNAQAGTSNERFRFYKDSNHGGANYKSLTLFGTVAPEPAKTFDLTIVQDTLWSSANAKIAAWIWGKELEGEWTAWATNKNDTLTLKVNEKADSIIFKRFAPEVEVPYWEGTAEYQWNEIAKSEIEDCHLFIITNWNEGVWCERPVVETKYYAKNNWNGAAADDWSWLEMSATDQENIYMLDSVVFGGTGVNINDKADDADALYFAADAITVLDGLDGLPGPIPPEPQRRDTIPYAPAHSGVVLEAPQLLAGDTIKLFFNAADSTLKAFIVGRPEQPQPAEVKYYVTGNAALVGEDNAWKAQAIEMIDSTYTFTELAAGEYEMKITNGAWDPEGQSWGSAALSEECSAGVGDKDGNIHFIVETANDVTVSIANGSVTVTGTFKQVATGITVNVTVPEGTPACFFYGEMSGNTFVEMDKVDDTHYTTTFAKATSIGWGYKFVWENGNWSTCNADPEGDIKIEPVNGVITVEVKAWATAPGTEYKYTTYTEWQVKFGPAWEWVNMTKQEDGTFTVEAVWGNTGINIASGENPIKKDWYPLGDPALTVAEGVVEGGNVVITLTVVDDETVALNVKKQTATNLNNVKAQDGKRYNILGQPVNETYRGIVIMNGQTYLQ